MHGRLGCLMLPLLVLALVLMVGCGSEDEQAASEPASTSPVSTATPSSSPTPSPPTIPGAGNVKLVFLRGDLSPEWPQAGTIWISDLNGDNAKQVTPVDVAASYMGLGQLNSGAALLYYITQDADGNTSIHSIDLESDETALVLSYRDTPGYYFADVSPDGRYVVHTQPSGLDMYDSGTGVNVTLFRSGNHPDCLASVLQECFRAVDPDWSPDGRLLKVVHTVYEGAWIEVVDPFQQPPAILNEGVRASPSNGNWAPNSRAVCGQGQYANTSALYFYSAPDWEEEEWFPEYEDYTRNPEGRGVLDCGWLNDENVAYLVVKQIPSNAGELAILNRPSGTSTVVAALPDATSCCTGSLVVPPGGKFAIAQFLVSRGTSSVWIRPLVIDIETGATTPVLSEGDIVLAAVSSRPPQ